MLRPVACALLVIAACSPIDQPPTPAPPWGEPSPSAAVSGGRPASSIRVIVVGDIMMARRVGTAMHASGDWSAPFRRVAPRLSRADIAVGTLESTLDRSGPPTQGDAFAADPRALEGVVQAGIDVLSLANNHVGDFGPRSLRQTVRAVSRAGIVPFGAGADERRARRPAFVTVEGVRFGFLGFNAIGETPAPTATTPGAVRIAMQPRLGPLDERDLQAFLADVRAVRSRVDVLIVMPHWGAQYTFDVHDDQRRVARALVRAGADAVIGGHPHWVGAIERYRGTPIVYSLGNFVFDMDISERTQQAIAVELVFDDHELVSLEPIPVVIEDDWAPRFARRARARAILADVEFASARL